MRPGYHALAWNRLDHGHPSLHTYTKDGGVGSGTIISSKGMMSGAMHGRELPGAPVVTPIAIHTSSALNDLRSWGQNQEE